MSRYFSVSIFCAVFLISSASASNRQGGDTIEDAFVIVDIPFIDSGTTVGWGDDYNESCPYTGNSSPDVVYSYTPDVDMVLDFSLCNAGTFYDTKMFIYENEASYDHLIGCNDDYCSGPDFPAPYLSRLSPVNLMAGNCYYIVICGYNGYSGSYTLTVQDILICELECPPEAVLEGEPVCYDDYDDQFNSGCGGQLPVYSPLIPGVIHCGTSGTFQYENYDLRDTDWYQFDVAGATPATITVCAEFAVMVNLIDTGSNDCADYQIVEWRQAEPCEYAVIQYDLTPGLYWVWIGPSEFSGVECGVEYLLSLDLGLQPIEDLEIEYGEDQLMLYWTEVAGATLYNIYASTDPHTGFELVDSTEDNLWGTVAGRNQQFFQVTYEVE